jgi:hypothetical protein
MIPLFWLNPEFENSLLAYDSLFWLNPGFGYSLRAYDSSFLAQSWI